MNIKPHAALVLIDVQNGFIGEHTVHLPGLLLSFLGKHATDFDLIIATRFFNTPGSQFVRLVEWSEMMAPPSTDLVDGLGQYANVILDKTTYSDAKDIAHELDIRGLHTAYLAGADTDVCVLQNAAGLFDLGYEPHILYDLCASNGGTAAHLAILDTLERTVGRGQIVRGTV